MAREEFESREDGGSSGEEEEARSPSASSSCSSASASASAASASSSDVEDAEDYRRGGYHPCKVGDSFKQGRYLVVKKLGWGHFSTVWLVKDTHAKADAAPVYGAMKIQKSAQQYTEAAMDEVQILKQIGDKDPEGKRPVVHLLDWFEHHGPNGKHVCIVLEELGDNLLTLVKQYVLPPTLPPLSLSVFDD